jgi:PAS domain S-box-containing protein
MADGVVVVDSRGTIEMSNKSADDLLGSEIAHIPLEEWTVRFNIASEDGRPLLTSEFPLYRALRGERVARTNFIVRSPWGGDRHLSTSAAPIMTPSGDAAGAAMIIRDVSDEHQYAEMLRHTNRELRRQAEELEQVNQQLREATKAKDQFVAVMSHELRTPINAIMGYSDLLDLEVKGALNADQKAMVGRVRETSRHLLGLINEVLDLAKIGAGRVDLVLVELPVINVVERAVQQVMPLATSKHLKLEITEQRRAGERYAIAIADETRLAQIIINLLSNAVKFTQEGGIHITIRSVGEKVEISVRDTGQGVEAAQQERIFEEFYQIEGGLARATGGTGLGLAIARRFARLMGGDIRLFSKLGEGSEFVVELPSALVAIDGEPLGHERTVALLLNPAHEIEQLTLELAGTLRVVGTADPARLAALARKEEPGVIALDAMSPDYAAWRALSTLEADPATAEIPKLLIAVDKDDRAHAVELGVFDVVSKPLPLDRMIDAVWRAGGGRSRVRNVVIADDDADVRRILGDALSAAGCGVRTATNGAEALRVIEATKPDVAVLDLLMPVQNGIATLARLHENPLLKDIPVIILAARELASHEMQQLQSSIQDIMDSSVAQKRPLSSVLLEAVRIAEGTDHNEGILLHQD